MVLDETCNEAELDKDDTTLLDCIFDETILLDELCDDVVLGLVDVTLLDCAREIELLDENCDDTALDLRDVTLLDYTRDETPLLDEICDGDLLGNCGVVLVDRMLEATLLSEEDRDDECTAEDDNMIVEDDLTTVVEITRVEILDKTIVLDGIFEDTELLIEETPEEGAVEGEIVILEEVRTIVDVIAVEMLEGLTLDDATLLEGAAGDNVVLEELLIPDVEGAVVVLELDFSEEVTRDDEDEAAVLYF
jgi:hypothetical protein